MYKSIKSIENSKLYTSSITASFIALYGISNNELVGIGELVSTGILLVQLISSPYFINKTNEVKQFKYDIDYLNSCYDEILSRINDMFKKFNLNDPISQYAMFDYLFRNGFISYNHEFKYDNTNNLVFKKDLSNGINVIDGYGRSDELVQILSDLYSHLYKNSTLHINDRTPRVDIYVKKGNKQSPTKKEDLIRMIKNPSYLANVCQRVYSDNDYKLHLANGKYSGVINSKIHDMKVLTLLYHNKSIVIDPLNGRFFASSPVDENYLINSNDQKRINYKFGRNYNRSMDILNYPSMHLGEVNQRCKEVYEMCSNNNDLFEEFYNENEEIYDEIHDRLCDLNKEAGEKIRVLKR